MNCLFCGEGTLAPVCGAFCSELCASKDGWVRVRSGWERE